MAARSQLGGILWLFDLIDRARPELTYDLRRELGVSLYDFGFSIHLREAVDLVGMLLMNPATWIHAAENEWDYPATQEWIVLKHLYDLTVMANTASGTPIEYPAPWIRSQRPKAQPRSVVEARLKAMNPERE